MVFALNDTVILTFDLVTSKFMGVIYVSHKLFKILSGHGFALNGTVTLTFDLVT